MPQFGQMIETKDGEFKRLILDLRNYINPVSNKKEIFTREDIAKMDSETFEQNEEKINMQMNSIGIPTVQDLDYCDTIDFKKHPNAGWVWVVDDTLNNCDFCLELNGKIFESEDFAPSRPVHDRCKCELIRCILT